MPSLDGVGRYFPLTGFACADEGSAIPPPELDPQDDWFAAIENFLLSTLDHDITYETISARLDQLEPPSDDPIIGELNGMISVPNGMVGRYGDRPLRDVFAAMRLQDHGNHYASTTYWWTIGGEGYAPLAVSGRRMPDPFLFSEMLTGRFAFGFE